MVKLGLVSLLVAGCACVPRGHDVPDLRESVGQLQMTVTDGAGVDHHGSCTAWFVSPRQIVSAGHCAGDDMTYQFDGHPAILDAVDHTVDLAVFDVLGIEGPSLPVADHDPCFGCQVDTVGYPAGVLLASHGIWSGRDADGNGVVDLVSYMGASGSPILDSDGRVVAVLVAIRLDDTSVTYGVNLDVVRKFLADHQVLKV